MPEGMNRECYACMSAQPIMTAKQDGLLVLAAGGGRCDRRSSDKASDQWTGRS